MNRLQAVGVNFAVWKGLAAVLLAVLAPVNSVEAAVVNSEQAIRVDFSLPIDPPFALPAYIIDHTVFSVPTDSTKVKGFVSILSTQLATFF
jgi:hypothetical protein